MDLVWRTYRSAEAAPVPVVRREPAPAFDVYPGVRAVSGTGTTYTQDEVTTHPYAGAVTEHSTLGSPSVVSTTAPVAAFAGPVLARRVPKSPGQGAWFWLTPVGHAVPVPPVRAQADGSVVLPWATRHTKDTGVRVVDAVPWKQPGAYTTDAPYPTLLRVFVDGVLFGDDAGQYVSWDGAGAVYLEEKNAPKTGHVRLELSAATTTAHPAAEGPVRAHVFDLFRFWNTFGGKTRASVDVAYVAATTGRSVRDVRRLGVHAVAPETRDVVDRAWANTSPLADSFLWVVRYDGDDAAFARAWQESMPAGSLYRKA